MNKYELFKKALAGDKGLLPVALMLFPVTEIRTYDSCLGLILRRPVAERTNHSTGIANFLATRLQGGAESVTSCSVWLKGKPTSVYRVWDQKVYRSHDGFYEYCRSGDEILISKWAEPCRKEDRGRLVDNRKDPPVALFGYSRRSAHCLSLQINSEGNPGLAEKQELLRVAIEAEKELGTLGDLAVRLLQ